mmetsp:Transcript_19175/g.33013  ORF Transcript_19175/g.33013 Transcript_19175/m.33013 type:complete len:212 (-) Transcript_19175:413-1048(-)
MSDWFGNSMLRVLLSLALLLCISSADDDDRNQAFIGWAERSSGWRFVITTSVGEIRITPLADNAPKIVQLVHDMASTKPCPGCIFYRHEPNPEGWAVNNFYGPPYALLQGGLYDMAAVPANEGTIPVKRGNVAMIPGSKDFFIATLSHEEWGTAHSVWGEVADEDSWRTIGAIPVEPFTTITDKGNITTRWLTEPTKVKFKITIETVQQST